jgi:hypothetical protein
VSVLFTLGVLAAAGAWALMVVRRLSALREQVKMAWMRLEPDQSNDAVRSVYNKHVAIYNRALDVFPAYLVGPATGFKPAKPF